MSGVPASPAHAWLTTEAPTGYVCRRFSVPYELLHIFTGALEETTDASHYEQFETLTPQEMADLMREVMDGAETDDGVCSMVGVMFPYIGATPPAGSLACDGAE
jgi:hypothetical protein